MEIKLKSYKTNNYNNQVKDSTYYIRGIIGKLDRDARERGYLADVS